MRSVATRRAPRVQAGLPPEVVLPKQVSDEFMAALSPDPTGGVQAVARQFRLYPGYEYLGADVPFVVVRTPNNGRAAGILFVLPDRVESLKSAIGYVVLSRSEAITAIREKFEAAKHAVE